MSDNFGKEPGYNMYEASTYIDNTGIGIAVIQATAGNKDFKELT